MVLFVVIVLIVVLSTAVGGADCCHSGSDVAVLSTAGLRVVSHQEAFLTYLYVCQCMYICVDMLMCMNMIVSCMSICAYRGFPTRRVYLKHDI